MTRQKLFSVTKKDLEITYYSGRGAGGQHRNRHMNCCRIKHPDSGTIVTCADSRSKEHNTRTAFRRLTEHPQFKAWHKRMCARYIYDEEEMQRCVDEMMKPENLLIETYDPENG